MAQKTSRTLASIAKAIINQEISLLKELGSWLLFDGHRKIPLLESQAQKIKIFINNKTQAAK